MPTATLSFASESPAAAAEAGAPPLALNVLQDGAGAIRRRPGISAWSGFTSTLPGGEPVVGLKDFQGTLYAILDDGTTYSIASGAATALGVLTGAGRPVFCPSLQRMLVTRGGYPGNIEIGVISAPGVPPSDFEVLDGRTYSGYGYTAPTAVPCTHIANLASRMFANDRSAASVYSRLRYTNVGIAHDQEAAGWDALNTILTAASPQQVQAIASDSNELWVWKSDILQVYGPDGNTVLAPGRSQAYGCLAPYSVIQFDGKFAWLNSKRHFCVADARSIEEISDPINTSMNAIGTVSDCYGFRYHGGPFECLVWVFPTDGQTFCYSLGTGAWSQWSCYDPQAGQGPLGLQSFLEWQSENVELVGLADGKIAKLDTATFDDLGDPIKAEALTGYRDEGTSALKNFTRLRITLRRGMSTTGGTVRLSWRDDGGAFCEPLRFGLGSADDSQSVLTEYSLGVARTRQWKLEMSDAVDMVVAKIEVDYEVLSS